MKALRYRRSKNVVIINPNTNYNYSNALRNNLALMHQYHGVIEGETNSADDIIDYRLRLAGNIGAKGGMKLVTLPPRDRVDFEDRVDILYKSVTRLLEYARVMNANGNIVIRLLTSLRAWVDWVYNKVMNRSKNFIKDASYKLTKIDRAMITSSLARGSDDLKISITKLFGALRNSIGKVYKYLCRALFRCTDARISLVQSIFEMLLADIRTGSVMGDAKVDRMGMAKILAMLYFNGVGDSLSKYFSTTDGAVV